ncbi:MAG: ecdysteroid 22-kinase family protein, partial [Kangiellaceae bacterium]|nr:ecdysteroid 22-kinase family protein [Kangiellaceae bacterium]
MQSPIELNVEKSNLEKLILKTTGASKLNHLKDIQTLWSGYGKIVRYGLKECDYPSVVVKHVKLPDIAHHPRGWNTDRSHQRKVKSYQVESAWYECVAKYCDRTCRVPQSYAVESGETEFFMLLEDLDAAGFPVRKQQVDLAVTSDWKDMQACLSWLANFHATFMNRSNEFPELWDKGSYWHLDTRPDELEALEDIELKDAAVLIDQQLDNCRYKTLIHGDAKLANFCFATNSTNNNSNDSELVAAVDFQYVG